MDSPPRLALEALPISLLQSIFSFAPNPALFRTCAALRSLFVRPLSLEESRQLMFGHSVDDLNRLKAVVDSDAASFRLHFFRSLLVENLIKGSSADAVYQTVLKHAWFDELVALQLVHARLPENVAGPVYTLLFRYAVDRERELRARLKLLDTGPEMDNQNQVIESNDGGKLASGPRLRNVVVDALLARFPPQEHCCCGPRNCDYDARILDTPDDDICEEYVERWSLADALLDAAHRSDFPAVETCLLLGAPWCARKGERAVFAAINCNSQPILEALVSLRTGHGLSNHLEPLANEQTVPPVDPITLASELDRDTLFPALLHFYNASPLSGSLPSTSPASSPELLALDDEEVDPAVADANPLSYFDHVRLVFGKRKYPRRRLGYSSPLLVAAQRGFAKSVARLLGHTTNPANSQQPLIPDPTLLLLPLLFSILNNRTEVVSLLLKRGAPYVLPYPFPFSELPLLLGCLVGSKGPVLGILKRIAEDQDPEFEPDQIALGVVSQADFLVLRLAAYFGDAATVDALIGWHNSQRGLEKISWEDVAELGKKYGMGALVRWAAARLRRGLLTGLPPRRAKRGKKRGRVERIFDTAAGLLDTVAGFFGYGSDDFAERARKEAKRRFGVFAPRVDKHGLPFLFGLDGCGLSVLPSNGERSGPSSPGFLAPHASLPPTMRFPLLGKLLKDDLISAVSLLGGMLSDDDEGGHGPMEWDDVRFDDVE